MDDLWLTIGLQWRNVKPSCFRTRGSFPLILETIHSFINGNGHTGQLLLNFELMREGYPPVLCQVCRLKQVLRLFQPLP